MMWINLVDDPNYKTGSMDHKYIISFFLFFFPIYECGKMSNQKNFNIFLWGCTSVKITCGCGLNSATNEVHYEKKISIIVHMDIGFRV